MDLNFERGDPRQPKGHALVYFRSNLDAAAIFATYVVVLPIALDLGKYIPPALATRVPGIGGVSPSVVPLPPIPEQVEGISFLQRLADARDDDLLFAGKLAVDDMQFGIQAATEIAQRYLTAHNDYLSTVETLDANVSSKTSSSESELNVHEIMYGLLGEHDRLQELSKLAGKLRYAVEGGDTPLVAETVAEMARLGKYFPPKYRIAEFVAAAQVTGDRGRRIAALYMDRCFKLFHEDYASLAEVEAELKELQSES